MKFIILLGMGLLLGGVIYISEEFVSKGNNSEQRVVESKGRQKSTACISCHGLAGEGHVQGAPILAGQIRDYLIVAMQSYADGRRKHDLMQSFVSGLSDEDMQDLADFYSSQKRRLR
ncbi:MAG: cytochrome c [Pseudomonadales bacterium]|nr:cytochrome c [Pseudomonadales bacterium]